MPTIPGLTPHSQTCLELFLAHFPQFTPYVEPSKYDEGAWYAEMPWPDGWEAVGLCARTHGGIYGEEFRVDLGNWHTHFGDYDRSGAFDFLDNAFSLIQRILDEDQALIAVWIKPTEFVGWIRDSSFSPDQELWDQYTGCEVWRRSWNGTYNAEWRQ
jgi:hypothetical protein